MVNVSSAFRGNAPSPLRQSTHADQKVYFEISIIGDGPQKFCEAPSAPLYTNYQGGGGWFFWSKLCKTCLKTLSVACFFKISPRKINLVTR